ncbi:MAG: ABC transporter ATP-binding protein, partial [Lachnospiraceae bacterium]|nr:ABC transporter ATP-binding protein [Lachnospiraceae bacterium]
MKFLIVFVFLMLQAFCELSLPSYTSAIVDVGIQQGGIENAVPMQVSKDTFEVLTGMMNREQYELVRNSYAEENGIMNLTNTDKEQQELLKDAFTIPMVKLYDNDINLSDVSDNIIKQKAIENLKKEYEKIGININHLQTAYLLRTGGRMLAYTLLMMASAFLVGFISSRTAARIGADLRTRVFRKVLSFSNVEMDKFSTASLITRSTNDIQQVQMVIVVLMRMALYAPVIGIGGVIKVAGTRTGMGWIVGVGLVAILMLISILMSIAMPKFKLMQTLIDDLNRVSREMLTGMLVIRAFSRERYEEKRFEGVNDRLMKTQLFTGHTMSFMMPSMTIIMNALSLMIVWFGSKGVDMGTLQVGTMIAFISYTMQIVMSFMMLAMMSLHAPRAGVAANRVFEILDSESSINDSPESADYDRMQFSGEISFNNVSFSYPGAIEPALNNISFTAKPGKT